MGAAWPLAILLATQAVPPPPPADPLTISRTTDPMTDAVEARAELRAAGGSLILMCNGRDRPVLIFRPTGFLGGRLSGYDWRDFTYRVDQGAPTTTRWKYVDSYAVAPSNREAGQLLSTLPGAQTLRVRAVGYDNSFHDATFDLTGVSSRLLPFVMSCGL